jgi:hypothetical protein
MTLTQPSASTEGSFLTIALRFAIRSTPNANVTVVTIGRPSGIAATASETEAESLVEIANTKMSHPAIKIQTSDSKHLQPAPTLEHAEEAYDANNCERQFAQLRSQVVHHDLKRSALFFNLRVAVIQLRQS